MTAAQEPELPDPELLAPPRARGGMLRGGVAPSLPAPPTGELSGYARAMALAAPARRRRRVVFWWILGSVLLHAAPLLILLLLLPKPKLPEPLPPPAYSMVFESGQPKGPTAPKIAPNQTHQPPPEEPAPGQNTQEPAQAQPQQPPPTPQPPTPEQQQPPTPTPPQPQPPAPQPPLPAPATPPIPTPPPPPSEAPAPALPPPPPAEAPPQETPPQTTATAEPLPTPPPPAPPPPAPAQPRPPLRPRRTNPFAGTLDLTQNAPRLQPGAPGSVGRSNRQRLSTDMDLGAMVRGDASAAPDTKITGPDPGPDWRNMFAAWLEAHKNYPRDAILNHQQGLVRLRFRVMPDGKVEQLQVTQRSPSLYLDEGAQRMLRNQYVPAFPPGAKREPITIDLGINYILIDR